MQLYFIRHGESSNNVLWTSTNGIDGRVSDPRLTEKGERQAQRVADYLVMPYEGSDPSADFHNTQGFGLTHLYCSFMTRAVQTATPIAQALQLPLVAQPLIHEIHGIYKAHREGEKWRREPLAGEGRDYFEATFPHLVLPDTLGNEGWWAHREENNRLAMQRAAEFLAWVKATHSADDHIAIVSHAGFYQAFMYALLSLSGNVTIPENGYPSTIFNINNCAITRVYFDGDFRAISYTNKVTHLPPELHTR
ncbi:MAG: histidine phosphatase family protein [Candidatus Promineifilaceae bacterium]